MVQRTKRDKFAFKLEDQNWCLHLPNLGSIMTPTVTIRITKAVDPQLFPKFLATIIAFDMGKITFAYSWSFISCNLWLTWIFAQVNLNRLHKSTWTLSVSFWSRGKICCRLLMSYLYLCLHRCCSTCWVPRVFLIFVTSCVVRSSVNFLQMNMVVLI